MVNIMRSRVLVAFLFVGVLAADAAANVSFNTALFANGMVLQQQMNAPVWGSASPGEQVTVKFAGQEHVTTADPSGHWVVTLDPLAAGGPHPLSVSGNNTIRLNDVMVGEVWLCGGQSNMVLGFPTDAELGQYPDVRAFALTGWRDLPSRSCWEFGIRLSDALGVPIGLLNKAAGGSRLQTWLGPSVYNDPDPEIAGILATYHEAGRLYEERVADLVPFAIRGVAWWQGESDKKNAEQHSHALPALIRSWREAWQRPDLPFIVVQLPTGKGLRSGRQARRLPRRVDYTHRTPLMRQAFLRTALQVANVSMVITSDLPGGVHPPMQYRPRYGQRFSNVALVEIYGESIPHYSGPICTGATLEANGRVRVSFRPGTAEGLKAGGGMPPQGVALLTELGEWIWAECELQDNELVAWSKGSLAPTRIRFAYGRSTKWANVSNGAGMLAAPFELPVVVP